MNCLENIRVLAEKICFRSKYVGENEQATKHSLVLPFLKCLGYDIHDPTEVHPEFDADAGKRKLDKVDYAIKKGGKSVFIVECKKASEDLGESHWDQLSKYFNNSPTDARIAVLTNGVVYRFYADHDHENRMDKDPFLEFDMCKVAHMGDSELRHLVNNLEKFTKDTFRDSDPFASIETLVRRRKRLQLFKRKLAEEFDSPSEDLVRLISKKVDPNVIFTKSRASEYRDLFGDALRFYIDDQARERQQLMSDAEAPLQLTPLPKPDPVPPSPDEPNFPEFRYWAKVVANAELHNLFLEFFRYLKSLGEVVWVGTMGEGRYFAAKPEGGEFFNICTFRPQPSEDRIRIDIPGRDGQRLYVTSSDSLEDNKEKLQRAYVAAVERSKT